MISEEVGHAFLLSLIAGLSTCLGAAVVFFNNAKKDSFLSFAMAFSAGVMVYVSFVEMLPEGFEVLSDISYGKALVLLLFFGGMFLINLIDRTVIHTSNNEPLQEDKPETKKKLFKTGVLVALALAIHNFPEGIATFTSSLHDYSMGVMITLAIAIHNIPEGIAVATPIYHATGSKKRGFMMALASGLAEPLGALVAFMFLRNNVSEEVLGAILAFVAGIMVYISFDFLLTSSLKVGNKSTMMRGLVLGMMVMAISLLLEV